MIKNRLVSLVKVKPNIKNINLRWSQNSLGSSVVFSFNDGGFANVVIFRVDNSFRVHSFIVLEKDLLKVLKEK